MAKQSPLAEWHQSNGALFADRHGWLLPSHFGNSAAEYAAVRSAAGIIDLSHRGLLQLTGSDRLSFLQGMLSNDLRDLQPGQGRYATILNQQGKVLADVGVLRSENSFYLEIWEVIKDKIAEHLNRYLVADEVEIADRSEDYGTLSIQGPLADALLQKFLGPTEVPRQLMQHAMVAIDDAKVCVVRASRTGEIGFDLIVPKSDLTNIAQQFTEVGKEFSAAWIGEEAQNILRIEAGIPRYGVDFSEDNLLLEVGIDHAVSFTKGCYLGQEVVERIRSRGHVNKKLCGLLLEGESAAQAGDHILVGDKEVGIITSSVYSPALNQPVALGYLHRDHWDAGTKVTISGNGRAIESTVTPLPFVHHKT